MSRWFRMYDDVLNDPKAQKLSDAAFRGWVNLMCLASKNDGMLEQPVENVAFSLRKSLPKTRELLQLLQSVGLLDRTENGWKPHNWDARQFKSDVSTERVKRFRKRAETVSETAPDTDSEQIQSRAEQKESPAPQAASVSRETLLPDLAVSLPVHMDRRAKPALKPKAEHETFPAFYDAYPLHKARPAAAKAYAAALSRASPDVLLDGAIRYAQSRQGEDPKFTKHPATWLNQDGWLDEEVRNDYRKKPLSAHDSQNAGTILYLQSLGLDSDGSGEGEGGGDVDRPQLPLLAS